MMCSGSQATANYQAHLRELMGMLPYRLDTNYAKMDRIVHAELEAFKTRVMNTEVHGMSVRDWDRLFRASNKCSAALAKATAAREKAEEAGDADAAARAERQEQAAAANLERADVQVRQVLQERLGITEGDPDQLLE